LLWISSAFEPSDKHLPIKIRFSDNGPGIHGQHVDRLGELGFSTKKGGTGLGLFISRGLTESLGGRIRVEETAILVGTTFLVELPLVLPSVEGASP
jgi:signal transduction histidine kinase